MDAHKILNELYQERQRLDEAILALEQLATNAPRKRGRPPKWLSDARKMAKNPKKGKGKE